jgi:hypothetical protein
MRLFTLIALSLLVIACNGSDNTSTDTNSTPFTIELTHIVSAVENQVVTINLRANENHTIASSELILAENAPVEILKISESEYQLTITKFAIPQEVTFQITATSADNKSATKESSLTLKFNLPPTITVLNQIVEADEFTKIIIELNAEDVDGHNIASYELTSSNQDVSVTKLSEKSFTIHLPELDYTKNIYFTAKATDEFKRFGKQNFHIKVKNDEPYFNISGLDGVLIDSSEYYRIKSEDLPEGADISNITWSQISGHTVVIDTPTEQTTAIAFPSSQTQESITLSAKITLSDNSNYIVTKDIITITNMQATIEAIDNNIVNEILSKRRNAEPQLDINQDGLNDIVSLEAGIVYVQYQTSDGLYQNKEQLAEVSFKQWVSDPTFPKDLETLRADLTAKVIGFIDMDNDSILDILYSGHFFWEETVGYGIIGWMKGTDNNETNFNEDFFSTDFEVPAYRSFLDLNFDGYIDWLSFNNHTWLYGPFTTLGDSQGFNNASSLSIVHFQNQTLTDASFVGDLYGDEEKDLITLVSSNYEWESGGKSWIKIHTLNNTTKKFNQDISISLPNKATKVHLVDVNDDGIDDIVFYDSVMKSYFYLTDIQQ